MDMSKTATEQAYLAHKKTLESTEKQRSDIMSLASEIDGFLTPIKNDLSTFGYTLRFSHWSPNAQQQDRVTVSFSQGERVIGNFYMGYYKTRKESFVFKLLEPHDAIEVFNLMAKSMELLTKLHDFLYTKGVEYADDHLHHTYNEALKACFY